MKHLFFLFLAVSLSADEIVIHHRGDLEIHSGDLLMEPLNRGDSVKLFADGKITICEPVVWSDKGDLYIEAKEGLEIRAIVASLESGNIHLETESEILLHSSFYSMAQLFSQRGKIVLKGNDLVLRSHGTCAEIIALQESLQIDLAGTLSLFGGQGGFADAVARISGQNVSLTVGLDGILIGGDGSRSMAEITALGKLTAHFGRNLRLNGGCCSDRSSAFLAGNEAASLHVGGDAVLVSGKGGRAKISSRFGDLYFSIPKGKLILRGDPEGGEALLEANVVKIERYPEIQIHYGRISSLTTAF